MSLLVLCWSLLLCIYFHLFLFVCFLTACFWRNEDACIYFIMRFVVLLVILVLHFGILFLIPLPPTTGGDRCYVVFWPSVRPSVRPSSVHLLSVNFAWRDISVLSGGISMKLGTDIRHVSWHWRKGFQCQKSRSQRDQMHFFRRRHTFGRLGVEANLFLFPPLCALMLSARKETLSVAASVAPPVVLRSNHYTSEKHTTLAKLYS